MKDTTPTATLFPTETTDLATAYDPADRERDSHPPDRNALEMPLSRMLIALAVVTSIVGGLHYYVWARLVRDTALPPPWYGVATGAIVLLALAMPLGFVLTRFAPRSVASPVMWVLYTWMGLAFFLIVLLAPVDLAGAIAGLFRRVTDPIDPERRQFLARLIGGSVGFGALGFAGAGLFTALRPVAIERVRVPLAKLPESLSGYTIVQLTDIHVGPTIGREFIEELVAKTNALEPDMVAITGDLVDGSVAELGPLVAPLARLRARDGVFFVTGNHEYYSGADEWIAYLRTLGVRVLRNEHVQIRGAEGFDLAGVDDWSARQFGRGHGMNLARAVEGRDASRALVLLAHQPKAIVQAEQVGVDLQISGHTHGGQMFPFNYVVRLEQPYIAGLSEHGRSKVYVSRGTGYWGPPMRLGVPAEITRIELVSEGAGTA